MVMNIEAFCEYCLSKPGTAETTPFGPMDLVFKVEGKIFAIAALDEVPPRANLKCDPDLALELRDRYEQVRPGYHMNKKHWNTVELDGVIPQKEIKKMIDHSYDLIVASLPKSRRPQAHHVQNPRQESITKSKRDPVAFLRN
jgi:predicted DNA-binding protein (MmcQ/YjbR family)